MSQDFSKILVKDDRLDVVDNIKYAVIKGGQNVTSAQFQAISTSNSQVVFNIQVPSEQTLIDRRVMLQTDLKISVTSQRLTMTTGNVVTRVATQDPRGCGYGSFAGLAPFPLHQMMTVASATINNNTVSINMRDVLPFIMRVIDGKELACYNGMTPCKQDSFLSYSDAFTSELNSLSGYGISADSDLVGRGSIALSNYNSAFAAGILTEDFTFHLTEPLLLSPFLYSHPKSNGQAFYGIQNMNIVLNMGDITQGCRVFRGLNGVDGISGSNSSTAALSFDNSVIFSSPAGSASTGVALTSLPIITGVLPGSGIAPTANPGLFSNTRLLMTFLTPHPSDLMPARNIVPYYELPRYISTNLTRVDATSLDVYGLIDYTTSGGTQLSSQTLQLNQIPDKLVIMVRKSISSQNWGDTESFLPIRKVTINFNNNSGILASAQCEDLFRMSKNNGSQQNWFEWVGLANGAYQDVDISGLKSAAIIGTGAGFKTFPTVGGALILEFGHDIQLVEDFYAPGSLGNFNIQIAVWVDNYTSTDFAGTGDLELVMITMNSGVFVCERGTSSTYTGILTRADVLEASDQEAYTRSDVVRLVGGGFMDMVKSGVRKLTPIAKTLAPVVLPHVEKYIKGKMGMGGISGGGPTGGLHGRYRD